MTEFGRRIRENNNRGTDHGHGSVMMVLGGNVNGGKVYANWPGLAGNQLYDGADLAITTDYRTVLSEILTKRTGNPNVAQVFPGYIHPGDLGIAISGLPARIDRIAMRTGSVRLQADHTGPATAFAREARFGESRRSLRRRRNAGHYARICDPALTPAMPVRSG